MILLIQKTSLLFQDIWKFKTPFKWIQYAAEAIYLFLALSKLYSNVKTVLGDIFVTSLD